MLKEIDRRPHGDGSEDALLIFPKTLAALIAVLGALLAALPPPPAHAASGGGVAIYNGSDAAAAPWEAYLLSQSTEGYSACTGAVVGHRWIMTAAHCFTYTSGARAGQYFDDLETLVVTGHTDLSVGTEALAPAQAEGYYISADWNPASTGFLGDVALIRLDRDVAPSLGIPPARADQDDRFAAGRTGVVSGWGLDENGASPARLRTVPAPLLAAGACAKFGSGFVGLAMICSGDDGPPPRGTCRGDSGGALSASAASGVPIAGGITSFGAVDCAVQPSGFTRVSLFAASIAATMAADPISPVAQPEIPALTLSAAGEGGATVAATVDANGVATNLEVDLTPTLPAAPLRRGARGGSSTEARSVGFAVGGLAPGVTYEWQSFASSVFGRVPGPSGQLTTPGAVQPLTTSPATTSCRSLGADEPVDKEAGTFTLTRRQLATNQRIGQAAIKRLNAIERWLNAGVRASDICGGGLGPTVLSEIELGRAGSGSTAPAPSPRALAIDPLKPLDTRRFSLGAGQLRTNQRIYQAALRRARALRVRLNGSLTGGDIRDGALGWDALPPGAMMTRFGTGDALPASVTRIAPARRQKRGRVRGASVTQLRINQRIAQAAVREANALRDRIEKGLTEANFRAASISARDFQPAIAARIGVGLTATTNQSAPAVSDPSPASGPFVPRP